MMPEPDVSPRRLVPARPTEEAESASFGPRIAWRFVAGGALFVSVLTGLYLVHQHRKVETLRAQLLDVHDRVLAEPAKRHAAFRRELESLIVKARATAPADFTDPRLRLPGLHAGKGLYLRLPASAADNPEAIERAARQSAPDAIASCLGLAPAAASGLWDRGSFLLPEWAEEVRKQDNLMALRVTDTVLSRQMRVDLPELVALTRSDWFLLVLEQGQSRRDAPVDVFLWDLRRKQPLLSGRFQGDGVLLQGRVTSKDAPPSPRLPPQPKQSDVATDCSIATQLKQRTEPAPQASP
jgi:hypothetical protein